MRALQSTILDSRLRPRCRRGLLALTACLAQIAYSLFSKNEVGATVLFCDYFSCTSGCCGILERKRKGGGHVGAKVMEKLFSGISSAVRLASTRGCP